MRVLCAASEIYPYVKTGGLGDVMGILPQSLADQGIDVRLFVPGYPAILDHLKSVAVLKVFDAPLYGAEPVRLLRGTLPQGLVAYVVDAPLFYDRPSPYCDENGRDWADNHLRFGLFCRLAADLSFYEPGWTADVIHGHDWQCGLIPAYLKFKAHAHDGTMPPATVMTIHNLAYQGLFPAHVRTDLGLPSAGFAINGYEFYNQVGFLKAGLYYSDMLTTVSPTYVKEICQPEMGCGLDGLLRSRASQLRGILNGIDASVWDPRHDPCIATLYDEKNLEGKQYNRKALLHELGLKPDSRQPVFGVVSRLVHQKGLDLLFKAAQSVLQRGASLVVLGSGDRKLEADFMAMAGAWPGQVAVRTKYEEPLAHRIMAGADSLIVPSRFEPCGLVQMYALRYGTLPTVRKTGGLADTVKPKARAVSRGHGGATGFAFDEPCANALQETLETVSDMYQRPNQWNGMQRNAMKQDFRWPVAARKYKALYKEMRARPAA